MKITPVQEELTTEWVACPENTIQPGVAGGNREHEEDSLLSKSWASVISGYGRCSRCSCPGFYGSSYTCSRGGCGHHYDQHW